MFFRPSIALAVILILIRMANMSLYLSLDPLTLRDMVNDNLTILLIPYSLLFIHAGFKKMEKGTVGAIYLLGFFFVWWSHCWVVLPTRPILCIAADMEVWQPLYMMGWKSSWECVEI